MNKKVLALFLVVILIGAGLFMFLGSDDEDSENTNPAFQTSIEENEALTPDEPADEATAEAAADEVTVTFTDDGFEPASQTISVGQTVVFVNNSSTSMWVASADHPTHNVLPEFDSKSGVGPGETYKFTFEEAGNWGYHDHLDSNAEGVITVTPN